MAAVGAAEGTARRRRPIASAAMQEGLQKAVAVPLAVMRMGDRCWEAMVEMARHGNPASRSDLEVGARALEAGIWGAYRNVPINLPGIEDEAFRQATADGGGGARRARGADAGRGAEGARPPVLSVPLVRTRLELPRMDCPAEEQLVRTALEGEAGLTAARVRPAGPHADGVALG